MIHKVAVALLCVGLLSVPATADNGAAIVAGQSAAGIRIGSSVDDAIAVLGKMYDKDDIDKYAIYDWPLKPFLVIAEKEASKVVLILVQLNDSYKTDKGDISAGSDQASVEAVYGKEFTPDEDSRSLTMIYDALGIAFDIGKSGVMSGRVSRIIIFVPGQWKQITGGL
jgi:hypothetical protein